VSLHHLGEKNCSYVKAAFQEKFTV